MIREHQAVGATSFCRAVTCTRVRSVPRYVTSVRSVARYVTSVLNVARYVTSVLNLAHWYMYWVQIGCRLW
jgi:hypothetical protein